VALILLNSFTMKKTSSYLRLGFVGFTALTLLLSANACKTNRSTGSNLTSSGDSNSDESRNPDPGPNGNDQDEPEVTRPGKVEDIFSSISFAGASVTRGEGLTVPLEKRFRDHLASNLKRIRIPAGYKPFKLFVGVDYFYPTAFPEILSGNDNEQVENAIDVRLQTLLKTNADQYFIGLGPDYLYDLYLMRPSLAANPMAENVPDAENEDPPKIDAKDVPDRMDLLRDALDKAKEAAPNKIFVIDFNQHVTEKFEPAEDGSDAIIPAHEYASLYDSGKEDDKETFTLDEITLPDGHPNLAGQAVTLNYVIYRINRENKLYIPYMNDQVETPSNVVKQPQTRKRVLAQNQPDESRDNQ